MSHIPSGLKPQPKLVVENHPHEKRLLKPRPTANAVGALFGHHYPVLAIWTVYNAHRVMGEYATVEGF